MIYGLLGLASLISHVFKVHPYYRMYQFFMPFYCGVVFHHMAILYFVYSFISCWIFGLFLLWDITNNASMNICTRVFVWALCFRFSLYMPRNGITKSCGRV